MGVFSLRKEDSHRYLALKIFGRRIIFKSEDFHTD
uniref:Uncharacterized protein n=1 Tax=Anguilla anguilla TaxID=7936 RepID=A0A0E9W308_ANGAN